MTILMTGDGEPSALYVAKKLGIDAFYSDASAEDKLDFVRDMQLRGYCVAMYGDGVNDVPALAQADIGISFSYSNHHAIEASNIISLHHSLDAVVDVKKICRKMSIKRGALIVFSLASDIAKYFAIVPSFFDTALPELKALNLMNLHSTDSALLASLIWSAIAIIGVAPLVFLDNLNSENKSLLWRNIMLYGLSGMIIPFVGIKLIDMLIVAMHLV
jgi:K+-transporting ATPase ATPase B chain